MPAETGIFDLATKKFLKENKLAREILRNAAKSNFDFFRIAGYADTVMIDESNRYVFFNGTLYDGLPVINDILSLGMIMEIPQGKATPSIYYFPEERSIINFPAKRRPEFRDALISLLDEIDSKS